jgi:molybdate-binding protein
MVPHDGVHEGGPLPESDGAEARRTLVLAGCDPATGLLAAELARLAGVRLVALTRSSRAALGLLGRGLVHVAGVHLAGDEDPGGNAAVVRETLGSGYQLLNAARWEEGIVFGPSARLSTVRGAVGSKLRWVGREAGSGARQCLDELLEGRSPPRRLASDHRGVAEAVRSGWADAGVCLRLVGEEAGLGFLPVRREDYDLCIHESSAGDHRVQALLQTLRSPSYRRAVGELPGYDSRKTGELRDVR